MSASPITPSWPSPDGEQIATFLSVLGKDPSAARVRAFLPKDHPRKADDPGAKGPLELQRLQQWQQEHRGLYVVVGNGGDRDAEITGVPALFSEWDDKPKEWQITAWQELRLPEPTLMVDTAGRSVHAYWVLEEPMAPAEWRILQRRLLAYADADLSISNPSRVMRLPGSWYLAADGTPTGMAQIIHSSGHRYRPEQIAACLPPEPTPETAAPAARRTFEQVAHLTDAVPLLELLSAKHEELVRSGCSEGGRNAAAFAIAADAVAAVEAAAASGLRITGTVEELVLQFAARCSPALPEREALTCVRSAESQERTPDPGLAERIAYQHRRASRRAKGGNKLSHSDELDPFNPSRSVATTDAPKLPPMPVAGGGKRLRLAPDDVLKRLPQMLGRVRLNIRTGDVMTEARGVLTGNQIARLYLELSSTIETWPKDATADAVMLLAHRDQFDPVKEWLEELEATPLPMEQWQRLDHHLLGIDDPIAATFLPRFLISAVARTMDPGCYVRQSPVLIGPQERGKTELGRILFGSDHWVEGVGALDRDALQRAHMAWGVELAELDGVTRRRDQEQLKAFLTECIDTYQIRYDRCPEKHPRRFVFWGTANRPPLRDSTGSTRFVCIPIPDRMLPLDWARQHRNALWARALEQYRAGVTWLRTSEQERQEVEARNADFIQEDPWAEKVERFLALQLAGDQLPVKVHQLLEHLCVPLERQNSENARRARQIAESLGWSHGRRRWQGAGPKAGLWPPSPQEAVHPSVHPVHPSVHPPCTPPDPAPSQAFDPAVHPVHPISNKGSTKEGEKAGTALDPVSQRGDAFLGCTGCTPPETPVTASDLPVHGGVHGGVHRGAQRGAHPDRIACCVDGQPGWTRKAGPMRGASVLVTDSFGHSELVGREQITDLPPTGPAT